MLNTRKLLYILPDVAYIAELMPAKKEHTFSVQSFRQINGEFMRDEAFVEEHIDKLFSKVEPEEYQLVLPDFVFTNTIVEVADTAEAKVKAYLKDTLLSELKLTKDTHELDTFILTQHQGKSKVQLSAIERTVLTPIANRAAAHNVIISSVSSLSWTIKSVISLEPSLSVVQAGSTLYLAEHYIGVDQTTAVPVDDIVQLGETIRTLKGAEPSIQTIYLLTNELVEDSLKQQLSSILPLQQLATFKEEETQMPSYIRQLIESGQKSLDISEYKVPCFSLPKADSAALADVAEVDAKEKTEEADESEKDTSPSTKVAPAASMADDLDDEEGEEGESDDEDETEDDDDTDALDASLPLPSPKPIAALTTAAAATTAVSAVKAETLESIAESEVAEPDSETVTEIKHLFEHPTEVKATEETSKESSSAQVVEPKEVKDEPIKEEKVAKVEQTSNSSAIDSEPVIETKPNLPEKPITTPAAPANKVIKNNAGISNMVKMAFVTLSVFFLTVAIGVGLGLGVLSVTNKTQSTTPSPTPSAVAVATTTPSPSPTASPSAALDRSQYSVMVVNATTIAGHAGKVKKQLETAGYKKVVASNAKGEYEAGSYILMKTKESALIDAITQDTELKLTYQADQATEDPKAEYDAIVVLAE